MERAPDKLALRWRTLKPMSSSSISCYYIFSTRSSWGHYRPSILGGAMHDVDPCRRSQIRNDRQLDRSWQELKNSRTRVTVSRCLIRTHKDSTGSLCRQSLYLCRWDHWAGPATPACNFFESLTFRGRSCDDWQPHDTTGWGELAAITLNGPGRRQSELSHCEIQFGGGGLEIWNPSTVWDHLLSDLKVIYTYSVFIAIWIMRPVAYTEVFHASRGNIRFPTI